MMPDLLASPFTWVAFTVIGAIAGFLAGGTLLDDA
jgi:hypothetical protein